MILLVYLLLGIFAGILAGLFGVGGGLIIVPTLIFVFTSQGMAAEILTHMAIGTSLATMIVTSVSSVRQHHSIGAVRWDIFKVLAPGIILGVVLGVQFASMLSGIQLQRAIGIFAILISIQMAFDIQPNGHRKLPGTTACAGTGGGIGFVSALFGIGGGSLTVPFLSWCSVVMQQAVATSAACGLPIAVFGAITNIMVGWSDPSLPNWSSGYVYWPAFLGIVLTSTFAARWGATIAHRLSPVVLKRAFAALLFVIGLRFLLAA